MYNHNGFKPRGRASIPPELVQMGVHLVYSEGTRTEPYYINNIKQSIAKKYKCSPNDIMIISATREKSYHTTDLVDFVFNDVQNRLNNGKTVNHVWIFFDKDDFDGFEKAHAMINAKNDSQDYNIDGFKYERKTEISWHSCWSNQCFELWLCLYLSYYNVSHDRKWYIDNLEKSKNLKEINFKYEKNIENIHDVLTENGGSLCNAIKNAKKLEKLYNLGDPSTGVYLFAEYFEKYMVNEIVCSDKT